MSLEIDINEIRYNPTKIQSAILSAIEVKSDGKIVFTDPTNPFLMQLEANISLTNDALVESVSALRKNYAAIATRPSDIFNHISDIEMVNMFAVPANATMTFMINLTELIDNGYRVDNSISMTIPMYSNIVVTETKFTLLNDIKITHYMDSGKTYIEQLVSDNDLSIKDYGVLKNDHIIDKDGNKWIAFETLVKQLERFSIIDNIITGMGFKKDFKLVDQYHYSEVFIKNKNTLNEWKQIKTTHSDIVFDPMKPTIHVKVTNNNVRYTVPEMYLLNKTISGLIKIVIYTSKGEMVLNINKFNVDDFILTLGNTALNESTAVCTNITTLVSSNHILDGGRDQRTMDEMRSLVINNTTGDNNMPLTALALKERADYNGYKIDKVLDVATDRFFVATKNLPEPFSKKIRSKMDIFMNTAIFMLNNTTNNDYINFTDSSTIVLRSGAIFINENNMVRPINNDEVDSLYSIFGDELSLKLLKNKHFYNPFYYMISVVDGISTSRAFDLDDPKLNNLRIMSKINKEISTNIDQFTTYTTNKGFTLVFSILSNASFNKIPKKYIKAQLSMTISDSEDKIYFYTTLNPVSGYLEFNLKTDFFVTEKDSLHITNGISELANNFIDLDSDIEIILYTVDSNITKTKYSVTDEIIYEENPNKLALSKEIVNLKLGKSLDYLWNAVNTNYTERKFLVHENDVPMTYKEDVYDIDVTDGSFFNVSDPDERGCSDTVKYKLLHKAGDNVLDGNGNPLHIHSKGDPILDEGGSPIIDIKNGVISYIDILMIEYEYSLSKTPAYAEYKRSVNDLLRLYVDRDMTEFNTRMLDNTTVFFNPTRSNDSVIINVGLKTFRIPQAVSPIITLYVDETSLISKNDMNELKYQIGLILHRHFDKDIIKLSDIKDDIMESFGNGIKGVKVENIDSNHNFEIFTIQNNTNRLALKKKLVYDINKNIDIEYSIDLRIYKI